LCIIFSSYKIDISIDNQQPSTSIEAYKEHLLPNEEAKQELAIISVKNCE